MLGRTVSHLSAYSPALPCVALCRRRGSVDAADEARRPGSLLEFDPALEMYVFPPPLTAAEEEEGEEEGESAADTIEGLAAMEEALLRHR